MERCRKAWGLREVLEKHRQKHKKKCCIGGAEIAQLVSVARLVIQAQVWLQVRISVEEGLSPGVNMCANSIYPRASPSNETINQCPRHRTVCVANRVAKSSQHPVHKAFENWTIFPTFTFRGRGGLGV